MSGAALAAAAAALVGTRFRLGGRDPASGLDCIGLLHAASAALGRPLALPVGYPLRVRDLAAWLPDPARLGLGLVPVAGPPQPGDVVLLAPGPAQVHLAIAANSGGWVHAHAGLRAVVISPDRPAGALLHHWRLRPRAQ